MRLRKPLAMGVGFVLGVGSLVLLAWVTLASNTPWLRARIRSGRSRSR